MPVSVGSRSSARKPGSQTSLRRRNGQLVIDTLLRRGPTTQADLSRFTGLSTGTISNLVRLLEANEVVACSPTIGSGRRAVAVSLKAKGRVIAGIDIDRAFIRVVICGFDQEVLVERTTPLHVGHDPQTAFGEANELLERALKVIDLDANRLVGIGISVAAAIVGNSRLLAEDVLLPNWEGMDLSELAAKVFPSPCYIENDANLGALAQTTFGPFKDHPNLVYLKLSVGIGAGLIVNHALAPGALGVAGEVGHIPVASFGRVCRCGNRGCLETVASTSAVIADIGRSTRPRRPPDEIGVIKLANARDPAALRALSTAGDAIGIAIAAICNTLNPSAVVIGGILAPVGAPLFDPIYRAFHRAVLPQVANNTALVANQLDSRTEALGAATLAMTRTPVPID